MRTSQTRDDYHNRPRPLPEPSEALQHILDYRLARIAAGDRVASLMEAKCQGAMDDALYLRRQRWEWFKGEPDAKPQ